MVGGGRSGDRFTFQRFSFRRLEAGAPPTTWKLVFFFYEIPVIRSDIRKLKKNKKHVTSHASQLQLLQLPISNASSGQSELQFSFFSVS